MKNKTSISRKPKFSNISLLVSALFKFQSYRSINSWSKRNFIRFFFLFKLCDKQSQPILKSPLCNQSCFLNVDLKMLQCELRLNRNTIVLLVLHFSMLTSNRKPYASVFWVYFPWLSWGHVASVENHWCR